MIRNGDISAISQPQICWMPFGFTQNLASIFSAYQMVSDWLLIHLYFIYVVICVVIYIKIKQGIPHSRQVYIDSVLDLLLVSDSLWLLARFIFILLLDH